MTPQEAYTIAREVLRQNRAAGKKTDINKLRNLLASQHGIAPWEGMRIIERIMAEDGITGIPEWDDSYKNITCQVCQAEGVETTIGYSVAVPKDPFERGRFQEYMKPEYDDLFHASSDGRNRAEWARDKAYDDFLNRADVEDALRQEVTELPRYTIDGVGWVRDKRLNEYRRVDAPHIKMSLWDGDSKVNEAAARRRETEEIKRIIAGGRLVGASQFGQFPPYSILEAYVVGNEFIRVLYDPNAGNRALYDRKDTNPFADEYGYGTSVHDVDKEKEKARADLLRLIRKYQRNYTEEQLWNLLQSGTRSVWVSIGLGDQYVFGSPGARKNADQMQVLYFKAGGR